MPFVASQMLYNDGYYKWSAPADHDNPYYKKGTDHSEINKTEGYEVLYFLNHIGKKRWSSEPDVTTYRKMERILRYHVPPRSTHKKAEEFIVDNWKSY
jgi:hypothetical protein